MITNEWIPGNRDISEIEALYSAGGCEADAYDAYAVHLILRDGGSGVAVGRVYHDGSSFRIGKYYVREDIRGMGYGDLLIKLLVLKAFEFAGSQVRLAARPADVPFFERYGFTAADNPSGDAADMEITKESMVFPAKCGAEKHFEDFFEEKRRPENQ